MLLFIPASWQAFDGLVPGGISVALVIFVPFLFLVAGLAELRLSRLSWQDQINPAEFFRGEKVKFYVYHLLT